MQECVQKSDHEGKEKRTGTGYPSIDKPWLKFYSEQMKREKLPHKTIYEMLVAESGNHLEDIAIEYYGNHISYGKLIANIHRCAFSLKKYVIKKGDIITVTVPEVIYVSYAASYIGAICNIIDPRTSPEGGKEISGGNLC